METATEFWKPVAGFPAHEVSNLGRVRTVDRFRDQTSRWGAVETYWLKGRILKTVEITSRGGRRYEKAMLNQDGKQFSRFVHRLVAEAFCDNPLGKNQVNHIDGNPLNNHAGNLEWVTQSENVRHAISMRTEPFAGRRVRVGENEYPSIVQAAKALGCGMHHVWKVLNGHKKTVRGMKAFYV